MIWYLPEETCFVLTGAAEEGGAWYPAWPHNVPSTQQTEVQSRSPGNSVKLKQSWRRQHQQHPRSPHRKPPQRGAHPHRLCPLPHNPSSTRRTTSSCLSPRSSPQSPGRLAQQCCKRAIQQIAHQYFWHRSLSECPRCTAPTPACGRGVWRRGAAGMATSRARLLPRDGELSTGRAAPASTKPPLPSSGAPTRHPPLLARPGARRRYCFDCKTMGGLQGHTSHVG